MALSLQQQELANFCWLCGYANPSYMSICGGCKGLAVPTRGLQTQLNSTKHQENRALLRWDVTTFDPFTKDISSHAASRLFLALKMLDSLERAVIKIGPGYDSPYHKKVLSRTGKRCPAVIILKSPSVEKSFTVDGHDLAAGRTEHLSVVKLVNQTGANQVFWNHVNQIMDLDTHSPVSQIKTCTIYPAVTEKLTPFRVGGNVSKITPAKLEFIMQKHGCFPWWVHGMWTKGKVEVL